MSTVVLDTITGKSTATTITIGSTPVVSASANSMTIRGEGTAQTSIQQGLAKAWVQTPSGGAAVDSFNVSAMTDNSEGNYTVTIANDMANDDYSVTISKIVAGFNRDANAESVATSNFVIYSSRLGAVEDQTCFGTIHGDLA